MKPECLPFKSRIAQILDRVPTLDSLPDGPYRVVVTGYEQHQFLRLFRTLHLVFTLEKAEEDLPGSFPDQTLTHGETRPRWELWPRIDEKVDHAVLAIDFAKEPDRTGACYYHYVFNAGDRDDAIWAQFKDFLHEVVLSHSSLKQETEDSFGRAFDWYESHVDEAFALAEAGLHANSHVLESPVTHEEIDLTSPMALKGASDESVSLAIESVRSSMFERGETRFRQWEKRHLQFLSFACLAVAFPIITLISFPDLQDYLLRSRAARLLSTSSGIITGWFLCFLLNRWAKRNLRTYVSSAFYLLAARVVDDRARGIPSEEIVKLDEEFLFWSSLSEKSLELNKYECKEMIRNQKPIARGYH